MSRRYVQAYDNKPMIFPAKDGILKMRVSCCDCGLVHDYLFAFRRGKVTRIAARNERATAAVRRGMNKQR